MRRTAFAPGRQRLPRRALVALHDYLASNVDIVPHDIGTIEHHGVAAGVAGHAIGQPHAANLCRGAHSRDNVGFVVAALELYLDSPAERRIRRLWDALEDSGVQTLRDLTLGRHRPHLSLLGAETLDGDAIRAALDGLPAAPPLPVRIDYIGQFLGRVLWIGPVPTAELLEHHRRVHERLTAAGVSGFDYYRPGAWVPHCTLSMRVPYHRLADAIRLCMDVLPVHATFTAAAVADHARGQYTPLL